MQHLCDGGRAFFLTVFVEKPDTTIVAGMPCQRMRARSLLGFLQALINCLERENGAGEAIRTLDPNLGKVMLYP